MSVTDDESILNLAKHIVLRLKTTDDVFYIHCWGGHGRSGTLVAVILTLLGMSAEEAILHVNECHRSRSYNGKIPSPQTKQQEQQVYRLA